MGRGGPAPRMVACWALSALSLGLHTTPWHQLENEGLLLPGWKPATPRETEQQKHQDGGYPTSVVQCSPSGGDAEMGQNRRMQSGTTPTLPQGASHLLTLSAPGAPQL